MFFYWVTPVKREKIWAGNLKTSINQLVKEMVEEDLKLAKEEVLLNQRGN